MAFISWGFCFFFFEEAFSFVSLDSQRWWRHLLNPLIWLATVLGLFILSTVLGFLLVLILSGSYQSKLAFKTLEYLGIESPIAEKSLTEESLGSLRNEFLKFSILTPVVILNFLLGLIPGLGIFALLIGSWLIAFPFFDVALETQLDSALKRIHWCLRNKFKLLKFGGLVGLASLVPLFWLFLPPIAVVTATSLLEVEGNNSKTNR